MAEPGLPRSPGGAVSRRFTPQALRLLLLRYWSIMLLLAIAVSGAVASALLLHHWKRTGSDRNPRTTI